MLNGSTMRDAVFALACVLFIAAATTVSADSSQEFELLTMDGARVEWARAGEGRPVVLTYAIITEDVSFPEARNCSAMTPVGGLLAKSRIEMAGFRRELEAAFHMWEQTANIQFREVANSKKAEILIGAQGQPEGRGFTNVAYKPGDVIKARSGPVRLIERSLICLNPAQLWKIGFDGNLEVYDLRYTLAHEIGHAIGLDHPSPSGQLMSFRYEERFRQLQAGDMSGARRIYGPPAAPGRDLLALSFEAGGIPPQK